MSPTYQHRPQGVSALCNSNQTRQLGTRESQRGNVLAYGCRVQTVENVRKRRVLEGFEVALQGRVRDLRSGPPKRLDGRQEADRIALRLRRSPRLSAWVVTFEIRT